MPQRLAHSQPPLYCTVLSVLVLTDACALPQAHISDSYQDTSCYPTDHLQHISNEPNKASRHYLHLENCPLPSYDALSLSSNAQAYYSYEYEPNALRESPYNLV